MQSLAQIWTRLVGDLGWVDLGALTIVALFALLGLVRGLVWQIGRAVALLGSFVLSGALGPALARHVFAEPEPSAVHAYVAYFVVFLVGYFVLAGAARLVHDAVRRGGLSLFDRLGGSLLGVGTGSAVVLGLLALALMFGQRLPLDGAVRSSHALRLGRTAVACLSGIVPERVRVVFAQPEPVVEERPVSVATPALDRVLREVERAR